VKQSILLLLCIIVLLFLHTAPSAHASSQQAYGDFQFQFDRYRNTLSAFHTAYSTYKQYGSLASQQEALIRVQELIPQRNLATKTYFLFLYEKLMENPGLTQGQKAEYQTRIHTQIAALDQNSAQAGAIVTFEDAANLDTWYTDTYKYLQADFRQTIVGIQLGYLSYFAAKLTESAAWAQSLVILGKDANTPAKQALFDRWLVTLTNKYNEYQMHEAAIRSSMPKLTGNTQTQERHFSEIQERIRLARQSLVDGVSYLTEIEEALRYE